MDVRGDGHDLEQGLGQGEGLREGEDQYHTIQAQEELGGQGHAYETVQEGQDQQGQGHDVDVDDGGG
mgnify:CR=1 FL=1